MAACSTSLIPSDSARNARSAARAGRDGGGAAPGREARAWSAWRLDVAEPRHHTLIESGPSGSSSAPDARASVAASNSLPSGSGPSARTAAPGRAFRARQVHASEAARIVEGYPRAEDM